MARVPYARLRRAEVNARREHPEATRVKAAWTPSSEHEIHVEVWANGNAQVVPA